MARSVTLIKNALKAALVTQAQAVGLSINPDNWSETDYKLLFLSIFSDANGLQEQLYDANLEDVENAMLKLPPQTIPWIRKMFLEVFEWDSTAVPIVQLSIPDLIPYYPNPNPAFNIVKYCAPVPGAFSTTTIKIAGSGPSQITGTALSAAQSFANLLLFPGITYNVVSYKSDKIFMQIDVKFNGLYASVIENNIISAIKSFFLDISTNQFNGNLILSSLLGAIKSVSGVIDAVFINVKGRADSTSVGSGIDLVIDADWIQSQYNAIAGYMIPEDTTGGNWRLQDYRSGSSGPKNLNLIPVSL